jgi:hypothetical protein
MARANARTHCAVCGTELDDSNCYRHGGKQGGWRKRCKACEAAHRRTLIARPPRFCTGCGRRYTLVGRTSTDPVKAILRDILCAVCRQERVRRGAAGSDEG